MASNDCRTRLSWRRDGQLFAVSSIDKSKGHRVVRIWSRELELQYTSDVTNGLESCLCWKPSGEVIAVSQQRFGRHEICFIEKNGLFLNSFKLPFPASSFVIEDVSWSSDSFVLAVRGCLRAEVEYLMLYSVSNYHWYLKQTFEWKDESLRISSCTWDPVEPLLMHVICQNGSYSRYRWVWDVCRSQDSSVAVIDGNDVLVTPFGVTSIPPPMSGELFSPHFSFLINELISNSMESQSPELRE